MIQEKVIKILLLLGVGVAKYFRVSMRCPKSRFSIPIIVFDELELIIFVSQGLALSTASLVRFIVGHTDYCLEEEFQDLVIIALYTGFAMSRISLP